MMKKLLFVSVFLLMPALLCAQTQPSVSSGVLTDSETTVCTGSQCFLTGIQVLTDGTNNAAVGVYTGNKQVAYFVITGSDYYGGRTFSRLHMPQGIKVTVSGTGAKAIIDYTSPDVM